MFKIILFDGDKNDATLFYLNIIEKALLQAGETVEYIENVEEICQGDNVLTITPKAFWKVKMSRKANLIFNWFQGIIPEEITFYTYARWKKNLMKRVYSWLENYALSKSDFNFFVSEKMNLHYKGKYGYDRKCHVIMPCFNQLLLKDAFADEKYMRPSFVYTGNLSQWQCFEPMILLYKKIKEQIPLATLTIYTKEQEKAASILYKYGVKATVKYIPYIQLAEEIKQYKYGFILREDNIVNNVATPTKMNSYLASGIIPIYTNVIDSYRDNLSHLKYAIPLDVCNSGIEKLFFLENCKIIGRDVFDDFKTAFVRYYNRDFYINDISKRIEPLLKK